MSKETDSSSGAISTPMKFFLSFTFHVPLFTQSKANLVLTAAKGGLWRKSVNRNPRHFSKKTTRAALAVFFCLLAPLPAHADKILLLGDSLSAAYNIRWESGWAQLLGKKLADGHKLINASVSGETTGGGLARLQGLLDEHQPDWVIIELGGNDGLRGYPLNVIRNNLKQLGMLSTNAGARPIYFGIRIPPNYGQRYNDAFSALFREVADELQAPYLNLFIEDISKDPDMMQEDRIHPSELAQPLIRDHVDAFLSPVLQQKNNY